MNQKLSRISLQRVGVMPRELEPGVLYVSTEFETAAHLCVCGCGVKVRTPLGPTEWRFKESERGPSLYPSIGNWQEGCQSHYWIRDGEIVWAEKWNQAEIQAGRQAEEARRHAYYAEGRSPIRCWWARFCEWLWRLFGS